MFLKDLLESILTRVDSLGGAIYAEKFKNLKYLNELNNNGTHLGGAIHIDSNSVVDIDDTQTCS